MASKRLIHWSLLGHCSGWCCLISWSDRSARPLLILLHSDCNCSFHNRRWLCLSFDDLTSWMAGPRQSCCITARWRCTTWTKSSVRGAFWAFSLISASRSDAVVLGSDRAMPCWSGRLLYNCRAQQFTCWIILRWRIFGWDPVSGRIPHQGGRPKYTTD